MWQTILKDISTSNLQLLRMLGEIQTLTGSEMINIVKIDISHQKCNDLNKLILIFKTNVI